MSVSKIIDELNTKLPECIDGKIHGLAQSVIRARSRAEKDFELLPGVVADNSEVEYVGFDDRESVIIYHKCNSITCTSRVGTGDSNDVVNTYNNCMIVYSDRQKTGLRPDELLLLIQANFPSVLTVRPYKTIIVKFLNVVLDDQVVFNQEYKNTDFDLPANKNLFQINYTIESIFNKKCFEKCP